MSGYFTLFPKTIYNGIPSVNIIRRSDFSETSRKIVEIYYPYTAKEEERADTLANRYYESSNYEWLIYFANRIVDPYYDYTMNETNFKQFIIKKYGSIENALRKIVFYRTNWAQDDRQLTPAAYNALPSNLKKYWVATVSAFGEISSYSRAKEDIIVNTNKLIRLTLSQPSDFKVNDIIVRKEGQNEIGRATISMIDNQTILINNVSGTFDFDAPYSISNLDNTTQSTVTESAIIISNLDDEEVVYYLPVTAYQYEEELNLKNKEMYLVDKIYAEKLKTELKRTLR